MGAEGEYFFVRAVHGKTVRATQDASPTPTFAKGRACTCYRQEFEIRHRVTGRSLSLQSFLGAPRFRVEEREVIAAITECGGINLELVGLVPLIVEENGDPIPRWEDVLPPGDVQPETLVKVDMVARA